MRLASGYHWIFVILLAGCYWPSTPTQEEAGEAVVQALQQQLTQEMTSTGIIGKVLVGDFSVIVHEFQRISCKSVKENVAECEIYVDYEYRSHDPQKALLTTLIGSDSFRFQRNSTERFFKTDRGWRTMLSSYP